MLIAQATVYAVLDPVMPYSLQFFIKENKTKQVKVLLGRWLWTGVNTTLLTGTAEK